MLIRAAGIGQSFCKTVDVLPVMASLLAMVIVRDFALHPTLGIVNRTLAHAVLILGAVIVLLPFYVMLGTSFKSPAEIGKPEPGLSHAALAHLTRARRILAIGDNPTTDGAGAARMGFDCAPIGPHVRDPDLAALLDPAQRSLTSRSAS